jgi:hypothetical protein
MIDSEMCEKPMSSPFLCGKCARVLLAAALLVSFSRPAYSQQTNKHQATGTIVSANATRIILMRQIGRNKVPWTFATASRTVPLTGLVKGARVRIYYHEEKGQRIADRWKIIVPPKPASAPSAPPANSPNPKPPS